MTYICPICSKQYKVVKKNKQAMYLPRINMAARFFSENYPCYWCEKKGHSRWII